LAVGNLARTPIWQAALPDGMPQLKPWHSNRSSCVWWLRKTAILRQRDNAVCARLLCRPTEHGQTQSTNLRAEEPWDLIAEDFCKLAHQVGV